VVRKGLILAAALALIATTTAGAASPRPDAHDRALVARLGAEVSTFDAVSAKTSNDPQLQKALKTCAPFNKMIDLVLVSKTSTAQDVRNALGIDPSLIAKLYELGSSKAGTTLTHLNPKMRAFFVAGGLTAKSAKALTS